MKLKLDDQGRAVLSDGKPVYVHDDGTEIPFDAGAAVAKIRDLSAQAEAAKQFDGLDPKKVRAALDVAEKIDAKKLIESGQLDAALRAQADAHAPVLAERDALKSRVADMALQAAFGGSKYITDAMAVPADVLRSVFGSAFSVGDDGSITAKDRAGNTIYSREKPGEKAAFDEALSVLVGGYPHRDSLLKASMKSGGGAAGGASGTGKTMSRAAFDALPPESRMAHTRSGGAVTD